MNIFVLDTFLISHSVVGLHELFPLRSILQLLS